MKHVMIDIETLGTSADAVILSIGLVEFNPKTNEIGRTTEFRCTRASQEALDRQVDPKTEAWWSRQSPEAQARLVQEPIFDNPTNMMQAVWHWLNSIASSQWDLNLWAKGPGFDMLLCRDLATQCGVKWKGHFAREFCVRTILLQAKMKGWYDILDIENTLEHGAEADATLQAKQVMATLRRLNNI